MHTTPGPASHDAQPGDAAPWRLIFKLFGDRPWLATLWLVLILGAMVALGVFAEPWVPGAIAAIGGVATVGQAALNARAGRAGEHPPDPALEPPP